MLFLSTTQVFGQLSIGEPAIQLDITISINEDNQVHVVHELKRSSAPQQLHFIDGTRINLKVSDETGKELQYAATGTDVMTGVSVFPSRNNVLVEYDLKGVLLLKDGIWGWDFFYPESTRFFFSDNIKIIYVNDRPVYFNEVSVNGINCHGCQMKLQYVPSESVVSQDVKWEEKQFTVEITTRADISSFNFDQPTKTINLVNNDSNQFITLKIPLELLWNPYIVFLDNDKIKKHEFVVEEDYVLLNIKPESQGQIRIIGTTAIPEFPLFATLFIGMIAVLILQFRKNLNLH